MCPACLSMAAMGVAATLSAGGLAALVARATRVRQPNAKEKTR
jgi:hypothetical protein